jgi:hypothetical protein
LDASRRRGLEPSDLTWNFIRNLVIGPMKASHQWKAFFKITGATRTAVKRPACSEGHLPLSSEICIIL